MGGLGRFIIVLTITFFGLASVKGQMCLNDPEVGAVDGKCFIVFRDILLNGQDAGLACGTVSGTWRIPTVDEITKTELHHVWVMGPSSELCYASSNGLEQKMVIVECSADLGVVCISVQDDVQTEASARTTLQQLSDDILASDDRTEVNAIAEFTKSILKFEEVAQIVGTGSTSSSRRKKRQTISGRRALTGDQIGRLQAARAGSRTLTRSRTLTSRRVTTGGRRISQFRSSLTGMAANVPRGDGNPPPAADGPLQDGRGGILPGERQGREMCMGGWKRIGRSCVKLFTDALNWQDAKTACETFVYKESPASLVNLGDDRVVSRLAHWISRIEGGGADPLWTSGNDLAVEGALQWTDTGPPVQPVGTLLENLVENDCVLYTSEGLQFQSCEDTHEYLCEMREPDITVDDLVR